MAASGKSTRRFVTTAGPPGVKLGTWSKSPTGAWEEKKQDGTSMQYDEAGPTGTPGSTTFRLKSKDKRSEVLILDTSVQIFVDGKYSGEFLGGWEGDQMGARGARPAGGAEMTLQPPATMRQGGYAAVSGGPKDRDPQQVEKLIAAAKSGDRATVSQLLAANVDPDGTSKGVTALFVASQEGKLEVLEELLKYGADVNKGGKDGTTPLQVAFLRGHRDVLKVLFNAAFRSLDTAVTGSGANKAAFTGEPLEVPETAANDLREVTARLASLNAMPTIDVKKAKRSQNEDDFSPKLAEEAVRSTMRDIITARDRSPSPGLRR
mmetsp:Transcript_44867/g.106453  ORF Transcript_44867/g.106453 Transcript_44867/m.106453 type:complete len:320 (+) Transcript_44867:83-1042(+)